MQMEFLSSFFATTWLQSRCSLAMRNNCKFGYAGYVALAKCLQDLKIYLISINSMAPNILAWV